MSSKFNKLQITKMLAFVAAIVCVSVSCTSNGTSVSVDAPGATSVKTTPDFDKLKAARECKEVELVPTGATELKSWPAKYLVFESSEIFKMSADNNGVDGNSRNFKEVALSLSQLLGTVPYYDFKDHTTTCFEDCGANPKPSCNSKYKEYLLPNHLAVPYEYNGVDKSLGRNTPSVAYLYMSSDTDGYMDVTYDTNKAPSHINSSIYFDLVKDIEKLGTSTIRGVSVESKLYQIDQDTYALVKTYSASRANGIIYGSIVAKYREVPVPTEFLVTPDKALYDDALSAANYPAVDYKWYFEKTPGLAERFALRAATLPNGAQLLKDYKTQNNIP